MRPARNEPVGRDAYGSGARRTNDPRTDGEKIMTAVAVTDQRGAGLMPSTVLVAKRALLAFIRTPQLVVLSTLQMAIFMVGFRYVFGGAIGQSQGISYVDFGVPGFVAAGVLYTTLGTATAMAEDLGNGLIDRMRSLPMPRSAVLTGRVLADTAVLAWSLAVTILIGFAIGFRLNGTVLDGLAAFGMCMLFGLAFSWVFIALGLLLKDARTTQSLVMFVFIVTFVSNAYVPASTMPSWLQGFAENQPVSPMVNAVRALTLGDHAAALLGHPASYFVLRSLMWAAAIMIVFIGLSVAIYRRR